MQPSAVESSMIHAVGHDPERRILEVIFNTGRTYQYADVPPEVYDGLGIPLMPHPDPRHGILPQTSLT